MGLLPSRETMGCALLQNNVCDDYVVSYLRMPAIDQFVAVDVDENRVIPWCWYLPLLSLRYMVLETVRFCFFHRFLHSFYHYISPHCMSVYWQERTLNKEANPGKGPVRGKKASRASCGEHFADFFAPYIPPHALWRPCLRTEPGAFLSNKGVYYTQNWSVRPFGM